MLHEESGKDYQFAETVDKCVENDQDYQFAETVDECVGNDRDYYRFNGGV